jgi:hypothetical protein
LQEKLEIVAAAIGNLGLVVAILTLTVLVGQFGWRLYSSGQGFEVMHHHHHARRHHPHCFALLSRTT